MADSNSTKSALADAMKKLMVCKSFAKISISDQHRRYLRKMPDEPQELLLSF